MPSDKIDDVVWMLASRGYAKVNEGKMEIRCRCGGCHLLGLPPSTESGLDATHLDHTGLIILRRKGIANAPIFDAYCYACVGPAEGSAIHIPALT